MVLRTSRILSAGREARSFFPDSEEKKCSTLIAMREMGSICYASDGRLSRPRSGRPINRFPASSGETGAPNDETRDSMRTTDDFEIAFVPRGLTNQCRRLIESYHALIGFSSLPDILWKAQLGTFIERRAELALCTGLAQGHEAQRHRGNATSSLRPQYYRWRSWQVALPDGVKFTPRRVRRLPRF